MSRGAPLEAEHSLWYELFGQNPAILLLVDPSDGRIVEASEPAARFYGYSRSELLTMRIGQINMLPPDEVAARMAVANSSVETRCFRFEHRLASGEIRTVDVSSGPIRFGGRTVLQSLVHDVTDHAAAEARREAPPAVDGHQLRPDEPGGIDAPDLVHRVNAILWEADGTDERMTFVSEGAASLTGHPAARWLVEPRFWEDHIHPDEQVAVLSAIGSAIGDRRRVSLEYRFMMADGTYRWFEDLVEILPGQDGHTRLVGVMIDVTDRRNLEEQLAYRATHDSLTGLLNRQGFEEILARALPVCGTATCAVLFLDLDDFKVVNDSLGHRAGDELLRVIAGRLRASVRASDAVARFGGDEFLVLATAEDGETLVELGHRLIKTLTVPSEVAGRSLPHPVSAGIAFVTPGDTPESAIRNADLAMYAAKQRGGNGLSVYDPEMHEAAVGRLDQFVG